MITNIELEQLIELEKKATKGKWYFEDTTSNQFVKTRRKYICGLAGITAQDHDFKLIAMSRNNIAQICEELLCAREVIEQSKKHVEWFKRLEADHSEKLGKSLEDAYKNWGSLSQESFDFAPLMNLLKAYDALCAPQEKTG